MKNTEISDDAFREGARRLLRDKLNSDLDDWFVSDDQKPDRVSMAGAKGAWVTVHLFVRNRQTVEE